MFLAPPLPTDIISLAEAISAIEHLKTAWVSVKLKLFPGQETFLYTACKKCSKALVTDVKWSVVCPSCKEIATIQLRCNIGVYLSDETTTITASIFSPDVEELIPFTPLQIKAAEDNVSLIIPEVEAALTNKMVVCCITYYMPQTRAETVRKYAMVKVYEFSEVFPDTPEGETSMFVNIGESKQTSPTQVPSEQQFFSPSTKAVIEEIGTLVNLAPAQPSGVKRSLVFDPSKVKKEKDESGTSKEIDHPKAAESNTMAKQTPDKKNKWALSFADSQTDQVNLPFEDPSPPTNSAPMGKAAQASASAESPMKKRKSKLKKN